MSPRNLLLETTEGVVTVTINRPAALNALNREMLEELAAVINELAADQAVRVIILTGAGERAFVAGADIAVMREMAPAAARELALLGQGVCRAIERCPKPVIAAVNGFALGGGCELALSCDIRLAAESARFGQPEVNLGIIPGFGGSQRLPRLVGRGRALELLLTGEMIDAQEAWRLGLVNRVVPAAELLAEVRGLARKIAAKGLVALRLCKEAVINGQELDLERACTYEADLFALTFATEDQREGMTAFLDKRPARFSDR
ncbi:crotonase [Geotalea uraniireducens]|uniref:Crotonase n=1 Tax=Geotalea uraniireducens TaxID=351604 RepID=A0ABM8EHE9_9BACT|nr:enoyl-CoA hydratase-related protein [Geotalea uraniireducens]BDV41843.1 crotonase [Geotalea uraniireducens]